MMFKQTMVGWSVAAALLAMSGSAAASGFALIEQSASGMGNAYAGGAASAEDPSTVFFNPAGMSRLSGKQVALAIHAIDLSAKFSGTGASGNNMGGDAGGVSLVPNAYFTMQMKPGLTAGLGLNSPFGLKTEYDPNWVGRYQAIKSEIVTYNVNPSLSYQVNDALSVGGGISYQHIHGELSSYGGPILGTTDVQGSDNTWGYNLGALYDFGNGARIGVAYRSTMSYTLHGTVSTSLPSANGPVSLDIKLPDTLSFSGFHQISASDDMMADITWTGWSTFKQVKVVDSSGATISDTPENWKDTVRISVGATHHYNEQWLARVGLAYDQSPVPDQYRTPRVPDNDRTWLAFGGQYKPTKESAVDVGYSHLFVKKTGIDSTSTSPALVGSYTSSVNTLSLQYTYSF